MAFSSGFLNERVIIATRAEEQTGQFGKQGQARYQIFGAVFANAAYSKGTKSLQEGAMDAYSTIIFRCRYHEWIDDWCIIKYRGKWYNIVQPVNGSHEKNEMQIVAQSMANQNVTIVEPSES